MCLHRAAKSQRDKDDKVVYQQNLTRNLCLILTFCFCAVLTEVLHANEPEIDGPETGNSPAHSTHHGGKKQRAEKQANQETPPEKDKKRKRQLEDKTSTPKAAKREVAKPCDDVMGASADVRNEDDGNTSETELTSFGLEDVTSHKGRRRRSQIKQRAGRGRGRKR